MANTPVTAAGPIEFSDGGSQFVIPLANLHIDDPSGALVTDWPLYAKHKAVLDAWLPYLKKAGLVTAAPAPPPAAAMIIAAKDPGSTGNDITLAFTNVHVVPGTTNTVFDAAVTQTDIYPDLTPGTLKTVLGSAPGAGSRPGLVFLSSVGPPKQPADGTYPLKAVGPHYSADISDGAAGTAFTVSAKADDPEAANTSVEIKGAADATKPGTFTLVATWTKPPVTGIQPGALGTSFAYEITVTPPPGGKLLPPAPGTVALRGGSDASGPTQASVTVSA